MSRFVSKLAVCHKLIIESVFSRT